MTIIKFLLQIGNYADGFSMFRLVLPKPFYQQCHWSALKFPFPGSYVTLYFVELLLSLLDHPDSHFQALVGGDDRQFLSSGDILLMLPVLTCITFTKLCISHPFSEIAPLLTPFFLNFNFLPVCCWTEFSHHVHCGAIGATTGEMSEEAVGH